MLIKIVGILLALIGISPLVFFAWVERGCSKSWVFRVVEWWENIDTFTGILSLLFAVSFVLGVFLCFATPK